MIRTLTPPISEVKDPSGRWRRTGGRRFAFSRTRNWARAAATWARKPAAPGPAVHQHQHRLVQQVQQLARPGELAVGRRAEYRADQGPGAGLAQGHELDNRVAGLPEGRLHLPQPGPVGRRVRDLDRLAPVEGDGAVPAEHHPGRARPGGRPGQRLEQRLQRRRAQPPPQVPQRLRRGHRQAQPVQHRGQLRPHAPVALPREQPQRQDEVDPDPRGQQPQPPLDRASIRQHAVHELERDHLRQLAQVPRCEHPRRHRDRLGNGHDSSADGRLNAQRRSSPRKSWQIPV